jgi:hypothetical protein
MLLAVIPAVDLSGEYSPSLAWSDAPKMMIASKKNSSDFETETGRLTNIRLYSTLKLDDCQYGPVGSVLTICRQGIEAAYVASRC